MKTVCKELMECNTQVSEHLIIEPAAMVDHDSNTVWAGIQIEVEGMNMPLFISVQDLLDLADEADKTIKSHMGIVEPKKTGKKLK